MDSKRKKSLWRQQSTTEMPDSYSFFSRAFDSSDPKSKMEFDWYTAEEVYFSREDTADRYGTQSEDFHNHISIFVTVIQSGSSWERQKYEAISKQLIEDLKNELGDKVKIVKEPTYEFEQ